MQPSEPSAGCSYTRTHTATEKLGRETWHLRAVVACTVGAAGLRHIGARKPAKKTGQLGAVLASALSAAVLQHTTRWHEGEKQRKRDNGGEEEERGRKAEDRMGRNVAPRPPTVRKKSSINSRFPNRSNFTFDKQTFLRPCLRRYIELTRSCKSLYENEY